VRIVRESRLAALLPGYSDVPFSYDQVGCTAAAAPPEGLHLTHRRVKVGRGRGSFERAAAALLAWRMHEAAGLRVCAAGPAEMDRTIVAGMGVGAGNSLVLPCRVVDVEEHADRCGVAYGTLADHPHRGEERVTLSIDPAPYEGPGDVWFEVTGMSRPGSAVVTMTGPVASWMQRRWHSRYEDAVRRLATIT